MRDRDYKFPNGLMTKIKEVFKLQSVLGRRASTGLA